MKNKSLFNRQFEALLRVRRFHQKHAQLFPPASISGRMFAFIDAAIPQLSDSAGSQEASRRLVRSAITAKAEARQILRDCVEGICRTARSIGLDSPTVLEKFPMPGRVGDLDLITTGNGICKERRSDEGRVCCE